MAKTPFKLKSGNSPLKTVFFGGTGIMPYVARIGIPKPMPLGQAKSILDENRDKTKKKKKKKKIKLKSTGVNIPTYGRKI